jgi:hypothetical protein
LKFELSGVPITIADGLFPSESRAGPYIGLLYIRIFYLKLLETLPLNQCLFPNHISVEETVKKFLCPKESILKKMFTGQETSTLLLESGNYFSVANCGTNIPTLFRDIFGIFSEIYSQLQDKYSYLISRYIWNF